MPLPKVLRSSPLMDLGLLAAAGFTAGAFWEGPGAVVALVAGAIAIPRLGRARQKEKRRRETLRRLIAQRRPRPPARPPEGLVEELKAPLSNLIGDLSLTPDFGTTKLAKRTISAGCLVGTPAV